MKREARIDPLLTEHGISDSLLSEDERRQLEEAGYLVLPGLLDASELERIRNTFEYACAPSEGATGTRHAEDLALLADELEPCLIAPRLLACAQAVIRQPFCVMVLGARDPLPGYGAQGLHADWRPRSPGEPFVVTTALWMLDDFMATNGATRVVPGSHEQPGELPKSLRSPGQRHPKEELITGEAGSVLVFNGHLWHSGTKNSSSRPRRAIQLQFVDRRMRPPHQAVTDLPEGLSSLTRHLFG